MPVSKLSTTTLGEALDSSRNAFTVASTANMDVGDYMVCRAEAMKIREILNSTQITVVRGVGGTLARSHRSGQRFFIGSPDKFEAIKESATALFGDSGTYPEFMLPGQRGFDAAGGEYVLLAPATTLYSGYTVLISRDGLFGCNITFGGFQGSVAVLVEAGTSDQYVWGQIYGYNSYCQDATATSGVTSAYIPLAQTSATTPSPGMAASAKDANGLYVISGMFIVGAASSTTTSATTSTGVSVPVWLNYPFLEPYGTVTLSSGAP